MPAPDKYSGETQPQFCEHIISRRDSYLPYGLQTISIPSVLNLRADAETDT